MFELGKLVFDLVSQLILGIVQDSLKSSTLSFFERRKIERRVEDATAEVVEGIVPFLEQEKVSQDKQQRLIETCINELKPFADNPTELFKGSLDGQKIFDNLYHYKELPKVIIEDDLKDTYTLLFPRIATLLCKIPVAVKDWENEAWSENYRRFDEIVAQLKSLFARVDEIAIAPNKSADETLNRFKRILSQKVGLQLDITGLRADQPLSGKFDDFFVLPSLLQILKDEKKEPISLIDSAECFSAFTNLGCLAIVIGAPGAGKSTWSKWLQRETLTADWKGIGIRIEFRELKSNELPSIYDLVRMVSGKQLAEDLTPERIRKWLRDLQISFIFDGFDEVKPSDRNKFIEWLIEISEIAKGCPFIVTSRPLTTDHLEKLGGVWKIWTIEPFDKKRIISYITKWFSNMPLLTDSKLETNAESLATSWFKDPTIGPLTSNPLLLSTLLMVHHLDGKLPNGRANLYKRYVDGMLGIWDDRHKLLATDIQINPDEKRKILRGIALYLFLLETETVDENIIHEWLKNFLPKFNIKSSPADVLLVLRERSGLIIGPGIYSFAHKTIAEFLVAETVLQGDQQDNKGKRVDRFHLFEHRNNDRWNTVLFLWAGMAPFVDLESFINAALHNNEYGLVYGLLEDQYDKFPLETRRKMMLELKSLSGVKWRRNYRWGTGFNNLDRSEDVEITIPNFAIRSISGEMRERIIGFGPQISTVVRKAVHDSTMSWEDYRNTKGDAYDLIWATFATDPINSKLWEQVLNSDIPASMPKSPCVKLIAHRVFRLERNNIKELSDIYRHSFPEFSGYIPISLMYNLVDLFLRESIKNDIPTISKHISDSLEIILQEDPVNIIPFIGETINIEPWRQKETGKLPEKDLLDLYIYALKDLINRNLIVIDKSKMEELISLISQLKNSMQVIINSTPAHRNKRAKGKRE